LPSTGPPDFGAVALALVHFSAQSLFDQAVRTQSTWDQQLNDRCLESVLCLAFGRED